MEIILMREIPILAGNGFILPIHPSLLDLSIHIDRDLAFKVLEQSAEDWIEEIISKIGEQTPEEQDFWRKNYFRTPRIITHNGLRAKLEHEIFSEITFQTAENGFATHLSLLRNQGMLYLDKNEEPRFIGYGRMCKIPNDKLKFYAVSEEGGILRAYRYSQHNVDQLAPSLFLRAWGVNYLNAALKSVL